MKHVTTPQSNREKRRAVVAVKNALRESRAQLSLLNRSIGGKAELRDVDLDCLDLISRVGPVSPSSLAKQSGIRAATMTGILDRLERGGWVARERAKGDRRAIEIRALPNRSQELFRLYSGMNTLMDEICSGYDEAQLHLIADFLRKTAAAGQRATEQFERDVR